MDELSTSNIGIEPKYTDVKLFFQDEASFCLISDPKSCWCLKGTRPVINTLRAREFSTVFGAVEPKTGDFFYTIEKPKPKPPNKKDGRKTKEQLYQEFEHERQEKKLRKGEKSRQMNNFMQKLANNYPNSKILLICDNAWYHKSKYIVVPPNITLMFIPPATPEMNPIEQIWKEVRIRGIHNKHFKNMDDLINKLKEIFESIPAKTYQSITQRDWIMQCFKSEAK